MRHVLLAIFVATLSACAMADDKSNPPQASTQTTTRPVETNPCAAYGAGYVRVEGTSTCIKVGGGVSVDAGWTR